MPLYVFPSQLQGFEDHVVISENPEYGVFEIKEDDTEQEALGLPFAEIPDLITALRRAYNEHRQTSADGTVAAVLLQTHTAAAPGDFS